MENLFNKLKSKYISNDIFDYIEDDNFKLKLFYYSKYFQNKLNLNLSYCYKNYLDKLDFDFNNYLYKDENQYKKDILTKEYGNFISKNKLDKAKFGNIVYEVINNQVEVNEEKKINIDSPLFEIISKTKDFDKYYTIYLSQKNIDECKLKNDYALIFNKLNTSNIKYSSIYYILMKKQN